jgi:hypothetical protein
VVDPKHQHPRPRPRRRPDGRTHSATSQRSKVYLRTPAEQGVAPKDPNHVSFTDLGSYKIEPEIKWLLRRLAKVTYGGITMSAVLRILIRREAEARGIKAPRRLLTGNGDEG